MNKKLIIKILSQNNDKLSLNSLVSKLKNKSFLILKDQLKKLCKDNKIAFTIKKNIYLLKDKYKLGKLHINPKGFGFVDDVQNNETYASYFVAQINLNGYFDSDKVVYQVIKETDKISAKIVELNLRTKKNLIGEIVKSYNGRFLDFIPSNQAFVNFHTRIINKNKFKIAEQQIVKAKILSIKNNLIFLQLIKIVGDSRKVSDRILLIAEEFKIHNEFQASTLNDAKRINIDIKAEKKETSRRMQNSLIDKMFVTIDGVDSKDLDDAICVEKMPNGNFKLYVAIADVSYYVKPKTALDNEALIRGNSTYLANRVFPMLPSILSNDLCSLNPNTQKFALVCEMEFNQYGNILNKQIYETIIISKVRLNYSEVNKYIANGTWMHLTDAQIMIDQAIELYYLIDAFKTKRGTITFDIREPKVIINENNNVVKITAYQMGESEKLIEQFMICANETVAEIVNALKLPFIYRNHDKPKDENLVKWYTSLKLFGIDLKLTPLEMLDHKNINKTLQQIKCQKFDPIQEELLNISLLRYMTKAKYELENIGHFGLSSNCYTHFTSPIRRYSDLIVHRYLKQYIINKDYDNKSLLANEKFVRKAFVTINNTETMSIDCEREVFKACIVEFMSNKIGNVYEGTIVVALKFGIFVQLDNMVEGLVHILNLEPGIMYNETKQILIKKDNTFYRMGQKVKIKVIGVNIRKRKIDFIIVK